MEKKENTDRVSTREYSKQKDLLGNPTRGENERKRDRGNVAKRKKLISTGTNKRKGSRFTNCGLLLGAGKDFFKLIENLFGK